MIKGGVVLDLEKSSGPEKTNSLISCKIFDVYTRWLNKRFYGVIKSDLCVLKKIVFVIRYVKLKAL